MRKSGTPMNKKYVPKNWKEKVLDVPTIVVRNSFKPNYFKAPNRAVAMDFKLNEIKEDSLMDRIYNFFKWHLYDSLDDTV